MDSDMALRKRRWRQSTCGLTFFEVLWVLLWLGCGVWGACELFHRLGWVGGLVGFVGGVGSSCGLTFLVPVMCDWWVPQHPPCVCGNRSQDRFRHEGWGEQDHLYSCAECGRHYAQSKRRVQRVVDKARLPYYRHKPFGRWRPVEN